MSSVGARLVDRAERQPFTRRGERRRRWLRLVAQLIPGRPPG